MEPSQFVFYRISSLHSNYWLFVVKVLNSHIWRVAALIAQRILILEKFYWKAQFWKIISDVFTKFYWHKWMLHEQCEILEVSQIKILFCMSHSSDLGCFLFVCFFFFSFNSSISSRDYIKKVARSPYFWELGCLKCLSIAFACEREHGWI